MAVADQPKYQWIPPPPLPEFYISKEKLEKKVKTPSSSSSATEVDEDALVHEQKRSVKVTFKKEKSDKKGARERRPAVTGDGAYDGLPGPPPPYRYAPAMAPPQTGPMGNDVPPLAIYHICRICLRPRSGRHHREHPIPINGVPPPPGICHRCRVTSVKDSSEIDISEVDEVVRKGRSNDVKIGFIAPFMSDEAMISNEEAKKMEAERYLRGRSRERDITIYREESSGSRARRRSRSRREDTVYRHVKVVDEPEPRRRATVVSTRRDDDKESHRRLRYERFEEREESRGRPQGQAPGRATVKSANLAKMDSTKASQSSQMSSSTSSSSAKKSTKAVTETVVLKRTGPTESEIRKIAGEEEQRYANDRRKPERTDSDIRRIAHEEVGRYRDAERKLDGRPGAFPHGRMVPVQRQIEKEQDEIPPRPWKEASRVVSPVPVSVAQPERSRDAEPAGSIRTTSYRASEAGSRSHHESWGPQWRRELSLERRRSKETREEKWEFGADQGSKKDTVAPPSNLVGSDKPRSPYDVVRDPGTSERASQVPSQAVGDKQSSSSSSHSKQRGEDADMGLLFSSVRRSGPRDNVDRERQTSERLSVRRSPAYTARGQEDKEGSDNPRDREYRVESDAVRSITSRSSKRWETSGSGAAPIDSARSEGKPWERGSEAHSAFLMEKERSLRAGVPAPEPSSKPAGTREPASVEYEYKLHTIRPADEYQDLRIRGGGSPRRSSSPRHVTLEVWQQVPTDPEQRAREAPMREKERDDAVRWLKRHMDDPETQVGTDSDGSRRVACSVYHKGASRPQRLSPVRERQPSPRRSNPPRDRSPCRQPRRSPERRRGADLAALPDREKVIEVWEQVPTEQAARYRRESLSSHGSRKLNEDGLPTKEIVIEAWKQVPSDHPAASNVRWDSAMDTPPARRGRERREHQNKASEDSTHVKFASKVEISPTPPGSEESSNAFRRFHDFVGRRTSARQMDGQERDGDLTAEHERRGRLRSRDSSTRKHSDYGYDGGRDRDETVKPSGRGSQQSSRRYDGSRDEAWRPLQRALSESPSREWDGIRASKSSAGGGPPYHPDERPSGSMTTHDGSRSGGSRSGRWW